VTVEDGTVYVSAAPVDPESQLLTPVADGGPPETSVQPETVGGAEAGAAVGASTTDMPVVVPRPTTLHENLLARAQELPGLEAAAQGLGTALRPIRESRLGGRGFDLLHGRAMGHALHPALSDLPIGLWLGAVILHIAGYSKAALILAIGGVIAGVATAMTGVADWTVSDGRDRRLGLLHGLLQTVALAAAVTSVMLQLVGPLLVAQILLAVALVISASSAYLGGHLVLGRGVMVDHTAWTRGPRGWVRAIQVTELSEGQPMPVTVEGRQILVSMTDGAVSAIENVCTHAGGPLSLGTIENGVVKCPWHGSCFRLRDGAVVKGPASHPQPMLEVRVAEGWLEVRGRGRW
jgi:nitrite reductase/ring-hydroxylating ferredoxin subunit/uncharacterized membrane protein